MTGRYFQMLGHITGAWGAMDHNVEKIGRFASYVREIRTPLFRQAWRLCGDRDEAEDLVQIALLRIYIHWDSLDKHEELAGYSRQTLRRTFFNERRRPRRHNEVTTAEPPDRALDRLRLDDHLVLAAAIQQLAPRQRAVVILRFWEDLSIEQTATMLGCSTGTVTSQMHRALRHLRGILADPDGSGF